MRWAVADAGGTRLRFDMDGRIGGVLRVPFGPVAAGRIVAVEVDAVAKAERPAGVEGVGGGHVESGAGPAVVAGNASRSGG